MVWSGFAAGTVYTGDVTHPDSTARTIPPVTQAAEPVWRINVDEAPISSRHVILTVTVSFDD